MKIVRVVTGIIVAILAGYGIFTQNYVAQPYMMLGLGVFVLTGGISEYQKGQKRKAMISFILSGIVFIVLLESFVF